VVGAISLRETVLGRCRARALIKPPKKREVSIADFGADKNEKTGVTVC